jgi:cytochrome c peroxidase
MHNGSMATLEQVIDFYSDGGRANPFLGSEIRPRNCTPDEKRAFIDFLRTLSGKISEGLR